MCLPQQQRNSFATGCDAEVLVAVRGIKKGLYLSLSGRSLFTMMGVGGGMCMISMIWYRPTEHVVCVVLR